MIIKVQCECGELVEVKFAKHFNSFRGMCPNCKLNNLMLLTEIQITPTSFKSQDRYNIKICILCNKKWMTSHTCKSININRIQKEFVKIIS